MDTAARTFGIGSLKTGLLIGYIIKQTKKNLNIIDLTGAGDLFAAGFLHGYINGLQTKDSLEKGTELSSKIIQIMGARL